MKNSHFLFFLFSLLTANLYAQAGQFVQAPIIVQRGSEAFQASTLNEAIGTIAQDGDIIYLPGGDFNLTVPIGHAVHIYGTGWRTDSTSATGRTRIFPDVKLNAGASGGSLNNVLIEGYGDIQNLQGQNLTSFSISRCRFDKLLFKNTGLDGTVLNITNTVLNDVEFVRGNLNLTNSIVNNTFLGSTGSSWDTPIPVLNINYCVLLHTSINSTPFTGFSSVTMQNSIMFNNNGSYFFWVVSNSFIANNLFVSDANPFGGASTYNIVKPASFRPDVFNTYTAGQVLLESHDLRTKTSCTECEDKGIYEGPYPFKNVPENPYVTSRTVTVGTDGQSLQLNFTINKGAN
jgi:hypothetical protein